MHTLNDIVCNTSSKSATPGKRVAAAISASSHSDYTCYLMQNTKDEVVAAKRKERRRYEDAVAQVICLLGGLGWEITKETEFRRIPFVVL